MKMADLKGCVYILTASVLLGLGVNVFSPAGIPLFGQWDATAGTVMAGSNKAGTVHANEINNPLKVKQMMDSGGIVLVDVRRTDLYELGHLPGALSFPLNEYDQVIDRFIDTVKKDAAVLLYCSGVACRDSHTFAARLLEFGYTDVSVYSGGYTEWQEMDFEVE